MLSGCFHSTKHCDANLVWIGCTGPIEAVGDQVFARVIVRNTYCSPGPVDVEFVLLELIVRDQATGKSFELRRRDFCFRVKFAGQSSHAINLGCNKLGICLLLHGELLCCWLRFARLTLCLCLCLCFCLCFCLCRWCCGCFTFWLSRWLLGRLILCSHFTSRASLLLVLAFARGRHVAICRCWCHFTGSCSFWFGDGIFTFTCGCIIITMVFGRAVAIRLAEAAKGFQPAVTAVCGLHSLFPFAFFSPFSPSLSYHLLSLCQPCPVLLSVMLCVSVADPWWHMLLDYLQLPARDPQ